MPKIALPIASTTTSVTVQVTERELAEEQIQAEMKQRVFGILPNFYSSYVWDAAPLESRQKFKMAVRARSDPFIFIATGVVAGIQQARNTYPSLRPGRAGLRQTIRRGVRDRHGQPLLWKCRVPHHLSPGSTVLLQGLRQLWRKGLVCDDAVGGGARGQWEVAAELLPRAGRNDRRSHLESVPSGPGARGGTLTFENAGLGIGFTAAGNLVREFVLRRITHGVADFNQGEKPIVGK